ncbi:MAG: type II toxin-antitoxin system HicA family toxin [Methanoregula sp.]
MSGTPILSSHDIFRTRVLFGYRPVKKSISHVHLWNEDKRWLVTVPGHGEFADGTLLSVLEQAAIGQEKFLTRE